MKLKKLKILIELFTIFFVTAIFTFGGGVAMLPVLERKLVEKKRYLKENEFLEFVSLTQILPGSFMIDIGVFIGYKFAGFLGAFFNLFAVMLPALIIITIAAFFFDKLLQFEIFKKFLSGILAGIVAEISGIILKMSFRADWNFFNILLFVFSIFLLFILKINPIYVVIIGIVFGISSGLIKKEE